MMRHSFPLAACAAALLAFAPAAAASATEVTNPADNPAPITVVVGGQTFTDGLDTLPGYDDIACTTIPDVSYDFDANEIHYSDGQVAHWTEWDRIPGYQVWLDQKKSTPTPKPSVTPSTPPSASSAPTTGSTTTSTGTTTAPTTSGSKTTAASGSKSGTKTGTTAVKSGTKTTSKPTAEVDAPTSEPSTTSEQEPGDAESTSPEPVETSAAVVVDEPTDAPTADPVVAAAAPLDSSLTSSVDDVTGSTTGGGLAILATLTLAGLSAIGVHRMRGQRIARRSSATTPH